MKRHALYVIITFTAGISFTAPILSMQRLLRGSWRIGQKFSRKPAQQIKKPVPPQVKKQVPKHRRQFRQNPTLSHTSHFTTATNWLTWLTKKPIHEKDKFYYKTIGSDAIEIGKIKYKIPKPEYLKTLAEQSQKSESEQHAAHNAIRDIFITTCKRISHEESIPKQQIAALSSYEPETYFYHGVYICHEFFFIKVLLHHGCNSKILANAIASAFQSETTRPFCIVSIPFLLPGYNKNLYNKKFEFIHEFYNQNFETFISYMSNQELQTAAELAITFISWNINHNLKDILCSIWINL